MCSSAVTAVACGDVERMRAVASATCVAHRRVVAQRLIGIGGTQRRVDFFRRVFATVTVTVGMRRIVGRTLMPERHEPRRAIPMQKGGVREIQSEVQRCDDAATPSEGCGWIDRRPHLG